MGLSFAFTSLAGALGILFGTVFVAFHASQGAELGLPQMIQSRAQFGYRGDRYRQSGLWTRLASSNLPLVLLALPAAVHLAYARDHGWPRAGDPPDSRWVHLGVVSFAVCR